MVHELHASRTYVCFFVSYVICYQCTDCSFLYLFYQLLKNKHLVLTLVCLVRLLSFCILKSPFGVEGWIVSVDNLEDIIGGHVWLGSISIVDCTTDILVLL